MDGVKLWTDKAKAFVESMKCPYCVKGPRFCNENKVKPSSGSNDAYICCGFRSKLWDERLW